MWQRMISFALHTTIIRQSLIIVINTHLGSVQEGAGGKARPAGAPRQTRASPGLPRLPHCIVPPAPLQD